MFCALNVLWTSNNSKSNVFVNLAMEEENVHSYKEFQKQIQPAFTTSSPYSENVSYPIPVLTFSTTYFQSDAPPNQPPYFNIKDWPQGAATRKSVPRQDSNEKQADANYEEVQMDLSEDSNESTKNGKDSRDRDIGKKSYDRNSPNGTKSGNYHGRDERNHRDDRRYDRDRRDRSRDKRDRSGDGRDRSSERKDERYSKGDRYGRDDRDKRDKDRQYVRSSSRDRRRSTSRDRRRSSSRERRRSSSRERKRSSSRDRRRSRSPRRDRRRSRSRSRSRSRGRYYRRYDRGNKQDKTDTYKASENDKNPAGGGDGNRFFMPGITGRFRDQIERRKLLWQKKDNTNANVEQKTVAPSTSRTTKVWEATTFAQDTDGKVASKFKRLMGIKGETEAKGSPLDTLKKQEELFSTMEQQYEVARTATHTMRGVGLGFGSYQR